MVKRQVVFWVDEEILEAFDGWRMDRRLPSRAAALVGLMEEKVGEVPPAVHRQVRTAVDKVGVIAELKAGLQREQAACSHPREKRLVYSWGARCEVCGLVVK